MSATAARWQRRSDVLWRATLGGVVVHAREAPAPVRLSAPAELLWSSLDRPRSLDELRALLDVDSEEISDELRRILDELDVAGLIEST